MMNPLFTETLGRVIENVAAEFMTEKIENRYAGAALAPLVGTFVRNVVAGLVEETVFPGDGIEPSFLESATRHYPEVSS